MSFTVADPAARPQATPDLAGSRRTVLRDGPRPVDVHVGSRIRLRRTMLGMSQEKLGAELDLTFQQVQKYERGTNRVGASRLWQLSCILDVPVSFFFDDMPPEIPGATPQSNGEAVPLAPGRADLELMRNFHNIKNERTRDGIYSLIRTLSKVPAEEAATEAS